MGSRDGSNPAGMQTGSNSSTGISEIRFVIVWQTLNSDCYEGGNIRSRWSRQDDPHISGKTGLLLIKIRYPIHGHT